MGVLMLNRLALIAVLTSAAFADEIHLFNNKVVTGKITHFNSGDGLFVTTDAGELSIKMSQVESFKISEGEAAKESVTFEKSRLKGLGFAPDFTSISGMDFQFDTQVGSIGEVLMYGLEKTLGIGVLLADEPMDITNEKYFETLDALQKSNFGEYTDTPNKKLKVGSLQVISKTYNSKVQGMDFTYKLMTFKIGHNNYRVLYWALESVFDRSNEKVMKFLTAMKVPKN